MRLALSLALLLQTALGSAKAAEPGVIAGCVFDDRGRPVAGAAIDFYWSANGPIFDADGKPLDLASEEGQKQYWSRFGHMEPVLKTASRADGRFSLKHRGSFHTVMAMDADRTQGGLVRIPKEYDGSEIEIRLQPLVRVTATIGSAVADHRPAHIMSVVEAPADPTRPLAMCRLVIAEARNSRLQMSLPPGRYMLEAHDDTFTNRVIKKFVIEGDAPQVDLGLLTLQPEKPNINESIDQSRSTGAMGDYTKNYGQPLPKWHIVDARGVGKDVQLADFKGKWVVVNFWALSCSSCLKRDLPRLAKFYEEHQAQRDQFEVLAVCIDHYGEKKSIAEVDRALQPIVQHVWNGKPLPFPILLDPSMKTLERFGVPGYETILIDPAGRLVEGDEQALAKILAEN